MFRAVLTMSLVLGLASCGGVEGDEWDEGADEAFVDDAMVEAESALTYSFTCYCVSEINTGAGGCGVRGPRTLRATVNTRTVKLTGTWDEGNGETTENGTYRYDSTYQGRGRNANYRRYNGSPRKLLVEKPLTTGGYALRGGGKGGYLQYTITTSEWYENVKYICKR